jgi:hypothetical protein
MKKQGGLSLVIKEDFTPPTNPRKDYEFFIFLTMRNLMNF